MSDIALQFNIHAIASGDMSADIPAATITLDNVMGYCVQAVWSGSPVGNIIVSGSNDNVNFTMVSTTPAGGNDGSLLINNNGIHYVYLQVSYSFTSGTGTLDAYVSGKK